VTRTMTWKKAYTISLAVHVVIAAVFVLLCTGAVIHHEPKMVVINLDSSEPQSPGSGHTGGGGDGSAGQTLFPDKLSAADMEKRVEEVTEKQSALRPQTPAAVPAVTPAADMPQQDTALQAAAPAPPSAPAADAGSGGASPAGGSGSGEGMGSGTGTGDGSGIGSGSGDGAGDGTGDGQGYGDGSGDGQGSGDSQTPGTGTGPFDIDGWQAAVNANKNYPLMAVKRNLQGTVTIQTTLDAGGNCLGVSVAGSSGQSLLDDAAVRAAYASCPYPNPTGSTVTITTNVNFRLN